MRTINIFHFVLWAAQKGQKELLEKNHLSTSIVINSGEIINSIELKGVLYLPVMLHFCYPHNGISSNSHNKKLQ